MKIYVQPRIGTSVVGAMVPVHGPVVEVDPTFARLRALHMRPHRLIELDLDRLKEEFPVWGDIRIGGRDLFTTWSGDPTIPGYDVGLVGFAIDIGWTLVDVQHDGVTTFDPHEAGTVLRLKLEGDDLVIHSLDIDETFRVPLVDALHAADGLSARARAFLMALDGDFREHPQLGPWIRGETRFVEY